MTETEKVDLLHELLVRAIGNTCSFNDKEEIAAFFGYVTALCEREASRGGLAGLRTIELVLTYTSLGAAVAASFREGCLEDYINKVMYRVRKSNSETSLN